MKAPVESSVTRYSRDRVAAGRIDVVSGPTGRRTWPDDVKGRIVAESYSGEMSASAVARRHGIVPSQLFIWRRLARKGRLAVPVEDEAVFAPLVVDEPRSPERAPPSSGPIEIDVGGVILRLPAETAAARIAEIVRALRSGG